MVLSHLLMLLFVLPGLALAKAFPPSVASTVHCDAQKQDIGDPAFDIQKMKSNVIYNSLYLYDSLQTGGSNPYKACYVNVYRSKSTTYECSTISMSQCADTGNRLPSTSYFTTLHPLKNGTTGGGTVCYAISLYPDLTAATFLGISKKCIVSRTASMAIDPCKALLYSYIFGVIDCLKLTPGP